MKLKIIGLTGNSGSGKSLAAVMLKKRGGYIIDADILSRDAIAGGTDGYRQVLECFGSDILDSEGNIDRKKLSGIVFQDREQLSRLESIVHHYVREETKARIEAVQSDPGPYRFIVIDAPLLIEANMHETADVVVIIYSGEDIRLKRIITRDRITEDEALTRMRSQMPIEMMRQYAHVLIENNGDRETLENEIEKLTRKWFSCSTP